MGGLFGKHGKRIARVSEHDKVMLKLKSARDVLIETQMVTELHVEENTQQAKQLLREGNREEAKTLLIKKRHHEKLLRSSNAQLDKIDHLTHEIELAQIVNTISKSGVVKGKRSNWKLFMKKQSKQRPHNIKIQDIAGGTIGVVKIQDALAVSSKDVFKEKERKKIMAKTRAGIAKQKKIEQLVSGPLRKSESDYNLEDLEDIMGANYPLPDFSSEEFEQNLLERPQGSNEVAIATELAVGA